MSFFKPRICQTCNIKYTPTSTRQKYCPVCSKAHMKQLRHEAIKRFRAKKKKTQILEIWSAINEI